MGRGRFQLVFNQPPSNHSDRTIWFDPAQSILIVSFASTVHRDLISLLSQYFEKHIDKTPLGGIIDLVDGFDAFFRNLQLMLREAIMRKIPHYSITHYLRSHCFKKSLIPENGRPKDLS
jgi:hypothetical protein